MKNIHVFISAFIFVVALGAGCADNMPLAGKTTLPQPEEVSPPIQQVEQPSKTATSTPPLVGGDRDAHGCIGSAGYRWCEPKNACLQFWETPCFKTPAEAIRSALADELKLKPTDIFVEISEITATHAKGSVGKVGEENGPAGMFLASQGNNIWLIDYHGNGQADCVALKERGYPKSMLKNVCD
jgi:hypothetical protein